MIFRKFCTKTIIPIPSPPLVSGIRGKILGNLAEVIDVTKQKNVNVGMGLIYLHQEWYRKMKSKTLLLNLLGTKAILSSDPQIFKEILVTKQDSFTNGIDFKIVFGYFFRTSVIVVDGEQWHRIRKIIQRAINRQNLDLVIPVMINTINKLFSENDLNKFQTSNLTNRVTFDVFHRVMYGWDPKSVQFSTDSLEILESCNIIAESIGTRSFFVFPLLWKLPTSQNRKIDKAVSDIKKFVTKFISEQRELILKRKQSSNDIQNTLLEAMIVAAESGEEGGLTNEELIDQISTLFFGAYDTTSNTLKFLLNYLARYPDIQNKLRSIIIEKFPNGLKDLEKATVADIESIDYLRYFVDEVNRLNALAPFFSRDCIKDITIGNYEIKKGYRVMIDTRAVGKDPLFWNGQTDLEDFRPERWGEHTPSKFDSPMPFGFGGRICPGRKIALIEMKVFLCIVLLNHQINLRNPNEEIELDLSIGLGIKNHNGNIDFNNIAKL